MFQNDVAGSESALVTVPPLPAHGQLTWVDDQLPKSEASSVSARVGEGGVFFVGDPRGAQPQVSASPATFS